jgi:hypothetical protein
MRSYGVSGVIVVAVAGLLAPAAATGTFAERAASHVQLLVHLTGPAPTQHGALPGAPGGASTPSGPTGPAPVRKGTFLLTGAVRDRGTVVLRLPQLGAGSKESTLLLRSVRGVLRVVISGDGAEVRWRVVGGSGAYAGAGGGGTLTQTPERAVLVGRLIVRSR